MTKEAVLYRKRIIPKELICLEDDSILYIDSELIVTKWNTLKPRSDISRGISAYFIKEGIKVSKIYNHNGDIVYWYCDIIDTVYDAAANSYTFTDLLADVLVYEDGTVKVVDLGEVATALSENSINKDVVIRALTLTDNLLDTIYSGNFYKYQTVINKYERTLL